MKHRELTEEALREAFRARVGQLYEEFCERAVIAKGHKGKLEEAKEHFRDGLTLATGVLDAGLEVACE